MDSKAGYADSPNGMPQGSVLAPLLFNIYIHDLPDTISNKYGYTDDLAILTAHREWKKIESTLSQDMSTLGLYLRQWRLKLSEGKTVATVFHLNNKETKHELDGYIDTRRLNFSPQPLTLGSSLTEHSSTVKILQDSEIRSWHAAHSSANLWVQDGEQVH